MLKAKVRLDVPSKEPLITRKVVDYDAEHPEVELDFAKPPMDDPELL
ncbi:hypothetical protein D918_08337 [Trichuris suis]|nr:hypothetical protein D918_08337 [Trichuris suis]